MYESMRKSGGFVDAIINRRRRSFASHFKSIGDKIQHCNSRTIDLNGGRFVGSSCTQRVKNPPKVPLKGNGANYRVDGAPLSQAKLESEGEEGHIYTGTSLTALLTIAQEGNAYGRLGTMSWCAKKSVDAAGKVDGIRCKLAIKPDTSDADFYNSQQEGTVLVWGTVPHERVLVRVSRPLYDENGRPNGMERRRWAKIKVVREFIKTLLGNEPNTRPSRLIGTYGDIEAFERYLGRGVYKGRDPKTQLKDQLLLLNDLREGLGKLEQTNGVKTYVTALSDRQIKPREALLEQIGDEGVLNNEQRNVYNSFVNDRTQ